jgi:hypothetical protein
MLGRPIILLLAGFCAALPAVAALPVADAGGKEFATRYVAVGQTVTLNGSGSYGRGCDLSYAWTLATKPAGSSAGLANAGSARPTLVPDKTGDYVISLVVGEAGGTSDPASVTVSAISPSPYPLPAKNADRWMGMIDGLMDRTLADITLPGTHDSAAYWLNGCDDEDCRGPDFIVWWDGGEWLLSDEFENDLAYDLARTQNRTVLQQLNGGIRSFDLRVTERAGNFYVYHGLIGRPLITVLQDIRTFMEQSEHEFVVVGVSHLATGRNDGNKKAFEPELHRLLMQQLVDQLGPYLHPRNGRSQADLRATRLEQVVAEGPKVLVVYGDDYFYKCDPQGCDFGPARDDPHFEQFWHRGFTTGGGYTDTVKMFDSMSCPRPVMPPDEPLPEARGQFTDQKCNATLHAAGGDLSGFSLYQTLTANWQTGAFAGMCKASREWLLLPPLVRLGWLAACYEPRSLHDLSRTVNPYLPSMLEAISPMQPNVMLVDFYEESAVVSEAIRLNRRDTIAPTSQATRHPPTNRYGGGFDDVTVAMTAAEEQGGSGVAGVVYSLSGAQSAAPAEFCGAETKVVVKAKGATTVTYHAIDRAGNAGTARTLQVRIDQQCDFNRDGRVDMADYSGLRHSLDNRSLWAVGDLNSDGQMSHQEWTSCLHKVLGRSR